MATSHLSQRKIGIKLASFLPPEIQCIILKFIIMDFLLFINHNGVHSSDHATITCSGIFQAQVISMTGYDDFLDDIISMALKDLDLTLELGRTDAPFKYEFINFVTSRSVQLQNVKVSSENGNSVKEFASPNTLKLLEFHADQVSLNCDPSYCNSPRNRLSLNFVTYLFWASFGLPKLIEWDLLGKLPSLTKFAVGLSGMRELYRVEGIMKHLQLAAPSVKHLFLNCTEFAEREESLVDFLVQADTFIRKHENLNIQFDIRFFALLIQTHWRLDSKTQLTLPLHTPYPKNAKEVDKIVKWCSVIGVTTIDARANSTPFSTNTEMIPFTGATNSTVSSMVLDKFSTEYGIILDGFPSLKKLKFSHSTLNKFPSLPESLRELKITFVDDLAKSDIDHGIILPTRLLSLTWFGNICCFNLPKILNIDKLHDLKSVWVRIDPFEFSKKDNGNVFFHTLNPKKKDFLRAANTCTIDELQQFLSQLPSDLETLKIDIDGYIRVNSDTYSACCPDKLSFKNFTRLISLEVDCLNPDKSFNVSCFPVVEHLKFNSSPVLAGRFAQGIRSLDINLKAYEESLSHFLSHFISELTNLVYLSVRFDLHESIDIRNLTLPSHICSFIITFKEFEHYDRYDPPAEYPKNKRSGYVILDAIPSQLNYFGLMLDVLHDVIVDDCKGETISSITEKISVRYGKANWIQYSHEFAHDEESFGIESLY
ncbi:unnamed protein product [Ambrosiozyma monospora]|uniref:Unnamed protein product n=1 Tax=Ambrosiozyma monospora TaxID=43982 RepID=A0ACB5SR91_AMBMO|nr:unnamed protein product [Ambrosiozyma monospora]